MSTKEVNTSIKIDEALEEFKKKMEIESKSIYTIQGYEKIILYFIKVVGNKEMSKVSYKDIEKLIGFMKPTNRNTSINTNLIHLNVFINNFGVSKNYNKGFKIHKLKVENINKNIYSKEEIINLLTPMPRETFIQMQMRVVISTFCSTGLRLSELISLKIKDLDMKDSVIYTRHTKTNKPRIVPVSASCKSLLKEWLDKRQYKTEEDTLFCNVYGEQLTRTAVQNAYYRYTKKKGIKTNGIHAFRRTFICYSVDNSVDIIRLAKITGHSQLRTLYSYYNINKSEVKKLADRVSILEDLGNKPKKFMKIDRSGLS